MMLASFNLKQENIVIKATKTLTWQEQGHYDADILTSKGLKVIACYFSCSN